MTTAKRYDALLVGVCVFLMICLVVAALCGWLPDEVVEGAIHWYGFCCMVMAHQMRLYHLLGITHPLPTLVLPILLLLGGWTLLGRVWRTRRWIQQVLRLPQRALPASLAETAGTLGLQSRVLLVESERPLAFCFGFLRPRICLSTGLLTLLLPEQVQAVLLHEAHHLQKRDPLRLLGAEVVSQVLFFLPAVREWCALFEIQMELAADRYAVQGVGRPALAGALHRLITQERMVSGSHTLVMGMSASAVRIAALLEEHTLPERISVHSLLRSAFMLYLLCLLAMI